MELSRQPMALNELTAISPIDGRYGNKTANFRQFLSEYGLIYFRLNVEIEWFKLLAAHPGIPEVPELTTETIEYLSQILINFDITQAGRVKAIESVTNHDVKAVEYYLKEQFEQHTALAPYVAFLHFACTSEDINNTAYALMQKTFKEQFCLPEMANLQGLLENLSTTTANISMLSRTHGQAASPTTMGKEITNFMARLSRQHQQFKGIQILAKFNGAVGNYNAHKVAYPDLNWLEISKQFIESLGLTWNPYTTQIEPHDNMSEYFHMLTRYNTILIDLCRDVWGYVSLGYFEQNVKKDEVGSSTMPHKVNPIDFENAEGNLGLSNALLNYFAEKLPISRWQRDLTDSTTLRNVGVGLSHSLIAYSALAKGLKKLKINEPLVNSDLNTQWSLLAEPIQTIMRKFGCGNAYEQLKAVTRGQAVNQEIIQAFITQLDIPDSAKQALLALTPDQYIGEAKTLTTTFEAT